MSFKRVDECLPAWLRAEIEMMKSGASAKPAPSDFGAYDRPSPLARPVLQVVSSRRDRPAQTPRAKPPLGAGRSLRLVVDNGKGGRDAREEEERAPAYLRQPGGNGGC